MDYNKLKVAELRDVLKKRGIPSTGLSRKQQIVDALEKDDASKASEEDDHAHATQPAHESDEVAVEVLESVKGEQGEDAVVIAQEAAVPDAVVVEGDVKGPAQIVEAAVTEHASLSEILPAANAPSSQPAVLGAEQSVLDNALTVATPPPTSSDQNPPDASSETRKRKRHSPTPPLSEDSMRKKVKSAEEDVVIFPEKDGGIKREEPLHGKGDAVYHQPHISKDTESHEQESTSVVEQPSNASSTHTLRPLALHPATRALYIKNLVRPLQPGPLRDHLARIASQPSPDTHDRDHIQAFHLDALRTHAFVLFRSIADSSRVRAALHGKVWPDEPARKPLWVDFVPDDKVQDWIEEEVGPGISKRDAKRWEVVYGNKATDAEDEVTVVFQEVGSSSQQAAPLPAPPSIDTTIGMGMPGAPSGPRRRSAQLAAPPLAPAPASTSRSANDSRPDSHESRASDLPVTTDKPNPEITTILQPTSESFNLLDQRFKSTTTKPKLYFLPVSKEIASERRIALEARTSRDWRGGRDDMRGGPGGQLKRYTFEDGDRVVDGGPDFGEFGRSTGGGRRGGGGSGGGSRYGGGARRGDRFRGGGGRWRR